jgi:hypothetical protein
MKEGPYSRRALRGEEGYTLVELSTGLVLTLLLGGLLYATYLFAARPVAAWRRAVTLENNLHLLVRRLAADLAYAEQLWAEAAAPWPGAAPEAPGDSAGAWTLRYASGRTVRYAHVRGVLLRDGLRMHDAEVAVTAFHLQPSDTMTHHARLRAETPEAGTTRPLRVEIRLTVEGPGGGRTAETAVTLRPDRPWKPMAPVQGIVFRRSSLPSYRPASVGRGASLAGAGSDKKKLPHAPRPTDVNHDSQHDLRCVDER